MRLTFLLAAASVALLTACQERPEQLLTGVLLDSAVSGVAYSGKLSAGPAVTSDKGQFECRPGDTLSFTIGGISLGSTACAPLITPLQLAGTSDPAAVRVSNLVLFLQMLDDDDDPADGIRINADVRTALGDQTIDFGQKKSSFNTALAALIQDLPDALTDRFGERFKDRTLADRRKLAEEHFEGTLASALGMSGLSEAKLAGAPGKAAITKYTLSADKMLFFPYQGDNARTKGDFPEGFFPAVGSGLAFKGVTPDGELEFFGITDRGPNADGPLAPLPANPDMAGEGKIFPSPDFTPSIGLISLGNSGAVLESLLPMRSQDGKRVSGRPLASGIGASGEIPLTEALRYEKSTADFDRNGLDPESLVYDRANHRFWVSDEYGPFLLALDASSGVIVKKYAPGAEAADLPAILGKRRENRGLEGLAMDGSGKLHAVLQSPIDDGKASDGRKTRDHAGFIRWLEFDPASEKSRLYAYPLDAAWYRNSETGNAKLGDLAWVGDGSFLTIEEGKGADGKILHRLVLVNIPANVSDLSRIGSELEKNSFDPGSDSMVAWIDVVKLQKTLLMDLDQAGWMAEKAEGIALVDSHTVALINDNDFGMRTVLVDATDKELAGSIEDCRVDIRGVLLAGKDCPSGAKGVRIARATNIERPTRLWLLRFPEELASYGAR